jgi:REP element-mobilizing transposase RayT
MPDHIHMLVSIPPKQKASALRRWPGILWLIALEQTTLWKGGCDSAISRVPQ